MIVLIEESERAMEREWTIFSMTTPVKSRETAGEIFLEMKKFRDAVEAKFQTYQHKPCVSSVNLVVEKGRIKSCGFELRQLKDQVFNEKWLIIFAAKKKGIRIEEEKPKRKRAGS